MGQNRHFFFLILLLETMGKIEDEDEILASIIFNETPSWEAG